MAAKKSRKSSSAKRRASRIAKRKSAPRKNTAKKAAKKPAAKKPAPRKATRKVAKKRVTKKKATRAKAAKQQPAKRPVGRRARTGTDRVGEIQRLIDVMVEAGAVEVELEEFGTKMRVRLKDDSPQVVSYAASAPVAASVPLPHSAVGPSSPPALGGAHDSTAGSSYDGDPDTAGLTVFNSPMVGTFYAAPSPDAEPFVGVGDAVDEDSTLCVLEAMKVMNEIKAEVRGTVVEILAQNGQPVEFGQPLFNLKVD